MGIHCKSTTPSCSAVAIVFMTAAAALLYPAAVQATELEAPADIRKSLMSGLILGEESLVSTTIKKICKDIKISSDQEYTFVNALLFRLTPINTILLLLMSCSISVVVAFVG